MFEDSLMESQNRLSSPNQRRTAVLSFTLQCVLVAAIVALPLFHPEALSFRVDAPRIMLPLKPVPPPVPRVEATTAASSSVSTPAGQPLTGPRVTPVGIPNPSDPPPSVGSIGDGMSDPNGIPNVLGTPATGTSGPRVNVASPIPMPKGLLHVSTGVSTGLLLAPIVPVYPRIAIAVRVGGTVKVEAIISKSGRIESAHVLSGPEMLRQAALDAIRNAHYTPYLLNGSPTEVETTITVNFKLSD